MKLGDDTSGSHVPAENDAAPRKPWQTPVVILATINSQTAIQDQTGTDASATPNTLS